MKEERIFKKYYKKESMKNKTESEMKMEVRRNILLICLMHNREMEWKYDVYSQED